MSKQTEVRTMAQRKFIELSKEHIGQPWLKAFGNIWLVSDFIGRILPQDVGKRVYLIGGILQVENDEQRTRRLT